MRASEAKEISHSRTLSWRCTTSKCYAFMKTDADLSLRRIIELNGVHAHFCKEKSASSQQKRKIYPAIKRKAVEDPSDAPEKVVTKHLLRMEDKDQLGSKDINNLKHSVFRERASEVPYRLPKKTDDVFEQVEDQRDKEHFKTGTSSKNQWYLYPFALFGMIFMTCATNLLQLCDDAVEHVLVDGTFGYCPKHFAQLYTIHIYRAGHYIPVAHIALTGKSEPQYYMMWTLLEYLCYFVCGKTLKIKSLLVDFELGAINAIYRKFPGITITGCRFHLSQAWFRWIQQHKGYDYLTPYLDDKSPTGQYLRSFFGLSFLPPDEVADAFTMLYGLKPDPSISDAFTDYLLENYIGESAQFPPQLWARMVTDHRDVRTTNGPEAFHKNYNSLFPSKHPNIYKVIYVLLLIQEKTFTAFTDIRNQLVRPQAAPQLKKDENVRKVWYKYLASSRSDEDLRKFLYTLGNRYRGKKVGKVPAAAV